MLGSYETIYHNNICQYHHMVPYINSYYQLQVMECNHHVTPAIYISYYFQGK